MRSGSRKIALGALSASLLLLGALGTIASAQPVEKNGVVVNFGGGIFPSTLPRSGAAPVSVQMEGKITTTSGAAPPKLLTISLAINKYGKIDPTGLPTCSAAKLNSVPSAVAKRSCGAALVGHGNVTTRVALPGQNPFATNGGLLAFNGKVGGKPAILAQVSSVAPQPLTYVLEFVVEKTHGQFGNTLVAKLPPIASGYGYISAFDMDLSRQFPFHGKTESFASADCPAPKGFTKASFSFAKANFEFEGGTNVSSTLVRECKVRG